MRVNKSLYKNGKERFQLFPLETGTARLKTVLGSEFSAQLANRAGRMRVANQDWSFVCCLASTSFSVAG